MVPSKKELGVFQVVWLEGSRPQGSNKRKVRVGMHQPYRLCTSMECRCEGQWEVMGGFFAEKRYDSCIFFKR